jgi:hypothetical protein
VLAVFRVTIVSNAIHLEAARRLRRREADAAQHRQAPRRAAWRDLLIHEPRRLQLSSEDRRLWPLRLAVRRSVMLALLPLALLGLVEELRLPHLRRVGRALRLLARRARRLCLIDDGLDQYRAQPRAVEPLAFAAGTPCWLFSDAVDGRAAWCRRFSLGDLGPLYTPEDFAPGPGLPPPPAEGPWSALVIDAPGLERLAEAGSERCGLLPPGPRLLVPHPVRAKRCWPLPPGPGDRELARPPEPLIATFTALVVVGESMTLLAALRLRPPGSPLLVVLPRDSDANLRRLVAARAALDPAVQLI